MLSKLFARQLSNPGGPIGWLAGWVWNRRNAALNDTVLGLLDLQPDDRVLDIGFGGGYLLHRMQAVISGGLLAGVDISPAIVAYTKKRFARAVTAGRLDLRCAAAEDLPYPADYFSKACSVNSIFYWQDLARGLAEMQRVLRPGGKAVVCFTCKGSIEKKGFARHIRLYESEEVAAMMAARGFHEIQAHDFSDRYRRYVALAAISRDWRQPGSGC